MLKRTTLFLIICFAVLCLSAAPALADFVVLRVGDSLMTVDSPSGDGTTATVLVVPQESPGTMDLTIYDNTPSIYQNLEDEPANLIVELNFSGSGNDYDVTGSLVVDDTVGTKIAADFVATEISWKPKTLGATLSLSGPLMPQVGNTSILSETSSWQFVGVNGTISLAADNPASYNTGDMLVLQYDVIASSLQDFLDTYGNNAKGHLDATVTPIPAAVLLGIIGLGVAGWKLRKYT